MVAGLVLAVTVAASEVSVAVGPTLVAVVALGVSVVIVLIVMVSLYVYQLVKIDKMLTQQNLKNSPDFGSANIVLGYSVAGIVFTAYAMVNLVAELGENASVMRPFDQLMWLWMASYAFVSWPILNKEDVYK